jgi:hypothetical protein
VVVMGPVAGGRLGGYSAVLGELVPGIERVPELALRFVLSNPKRIRQLAQLARGLNLAANAAATAAVSALKITYTS